MKEMSFIRKTLKMFNL